MTSIGEEGWWNLSQKCHWDPTFVFNNSINGKISLSLSATSFYIKPQFDVFVKIYHFKLNLDETSFVCNGGV